MTVVASGIDRPYAVVRAPSGAIFLSSSNVLRRIEGGTNTIVAEVDRQIGPVTVGSNGDVYYATANRIFRLGGCFGPPTLIAGTGVQGGGGDGGPALAAEVSSPHGLGLTADGGLLVSDTDNNRIRRIDLASGIITALAEVQLPLGMDVGADGTIYVVDGRARRVVHLSSSGVRVGLVGPVFSLPYDVEVSADGVVYMIDAGRVGRLRRIAVDGTVTTVSRR